MRILHILSTDHISGAENVAADLCMMFNDEHESAYCSPEGQIRESLSSRGVTFIPIAAATGTEVKRAIQLFLPDIVHAHGIRATVATVMAGTKIPIVSHLHGNGEDMRRVSVKAMTYALSSQRAASIITVSESILQDYVFRSVIQKKSTCLRNILYMPRIARLVEQDEQKYAFDFVFLGRIAYPKNPARVAQVAAAVLKKHPGLTFGVIGDGGMKGVMEEVFEAEGVSDQVVFTGNLPFPYKALGQAKCMLMCSHFEGTPIAALEAMALGVPIVSTPVDGMKEIVAEGMTGYLSDEDAELVAAVERILLEPGAHADMSAGTVARFNQLNDERGYRRQILGIYEQALGDVKVQPLSS